jgi:hypothetical protein
MRLAIRATTSRQSWETMGGGGSFIKTASHTDLDPGWASRPTDRAPSCTSVIEGLRTRRCSERIIGSVFERLKSMDQVLEALFGELPHGKPVVIEEEEEEPRC